MGKGVTEMTYSINVEKQAQIIHVTLTMDQPEVDLSESWGAIAQACKGLRCDKVLVESRIEDPRTSMLLYDLVYYLTKLGFSPQHKVAFVSYQTGVELSRAEQMLANAAINGRIFTDLEEARAWLGE